jgi:hypothetical protein
MRDRKKRTLSLAEKRALASAGLTVTRYDAAGERATVQQLAPDFALRSPNGTDASKGEPT